MMTNETYHKIFFHSYCGQNCVIACFNLLFIINIYNRQNLHLELTINIELIISIHWPYVVVLLIFIQILLSPNKLGKLAGEERSFMVIF